MVDIVIGNYVMVETDPEKVVQAAVEDQATALAERHVSLGHLSEDRVVDFGTED